MNLARLSRAYQFGRHMPADKLLSRIALSLRRKWRDRFGAKLDIAPPPARNATPLLPLFAPRHGQIALESGITFTFIGRAISMPGGINWNAPGKGPEHQLWRMNLHYMEYLEDVDNEAFFSLVNQWINDNPPAQRGNWKDSWNSYALSLRVMVWMQEIARRQLSGDALTPILASLAVQLRFLAQNLETDLGGNHLVKNIKALLWASRFFGGTEAQNWHQLGLKWLKIALNEQILPDGMHYERSPAYHNQVFADLLECAHALGQNYARLNEALHKMAQATADLAHPDRLIAQFNDAGLNMAYAPDECLDVFARLYGQRPAPRAVFSFPDAGYFGLRANETALIADCGRIAPDDLPAHGHGDILSFEYSVGGLRFIVDQGVFEYIAGQKRQISRSAAAHNTLCFDDGDQADFFGAFRCGHRPDVTASFTAQGDGFTLTGSHNGFARLKGAPRHTRTFTATPDSLVIEDTIENPAGLPATISFLLHPEVTAAPTPTGLLLTRGTARLILKTENPLTFEDAVYWPDMGHEFPTRRICLHTDMKNSVVLTRFDGVTPSIQ